MRLALGLVAMGVGLAFFWLALTLTGLGMFCFDGALFGGFDSPTALAPDCVLVHLSDRINPKIWLVTNLFGSGVLGLWAFTTGYGFLRGRPWVTTCIFSGGLIGSGFFAALAIALSEFRTLGVICSAILGCMTIGSRARLLLRGQHSC